MKQPPWYQRTAGWWVMSAKKDETRQRRLDMLITASAAGRQVGAVDIGGQKSEARDQGSGVRGRGETRARLGSWNIAVEEAREGHCKGTRAKASRNSE